MKKSLHKILAMLFLIVLCTSFFIACKQDDSSKDQTQTENELENIVEDRLVSDYMEYADLAKNAVVLDGGVVHFYKRLKTVLTNDASDYLLEGSYHYEGKRPVGVLGEGNKFLEFFWDGLSTELRFYDLADFLSSDKKDFSHYRRLVFPGRLKDVKITDGVLNGTLYYGRTGAEKLYYYETTGKNNIKTEIGEVSSDGTTRRGLVAFKIPLEKNGAIKVKYITSRYPDRVYIQGDALYSLAKKYIKNSLSYSLNGYVVTGYLSDNFTKKFEIEPLDGYANSFYADENGCATIYVKLNKVNDDGEYKYDRIFKYTEIASGKTYQRKIETDFGYAPTSVVFYEKKAFINFHINNFQNSWFGIKQEVFDFSNPKNISAEMREISFVGLLDYYEGRIRCYENYLIVVQTNRVTVIDILSGKVEYRVNFLSAHTVINSSSLRYDSGCLYFTTGIGDAEKTYIMTASDGKDYQCVLDGYNPIVSIEGNHIYLSDAGGITVYNSLLNYRNYYDTRPMHTISFDTDGGSPIDDIEIEDGGKLMTAEINALYTERDGYRLLYWKEVSGKKFYNIASDLRLNAVWEKLPEGGFEDEI